MVLTKNALTKQLANMGPGLAWLTSAGKCSNWVREFLNYSHQQAVRSKVLEDFSSLLPTFKGWITPSPVSGEKKEKAWRKYREALQKLPDDKSTMFNENLGVRDVFVQPLVTYNVAGARREQGKVIPDVADLIGTLLSDRAAYGDLILLCGGPGSGKSTLCKYLASELAQDEQVHPVFVRLRRLQEGQDIRKFLEDHLQNEGVIDKLSELSDVNSLIIILDGFDELVMASRSRVMQFFNALEIDFQSGPLRNAKTIVSGRDTRFPKGVGLPIGAHVISLLPFDKAKIETWGRKWRSSQAAGRISDFYPEKFFTEGAEKRLTKPLHHLVSWPLTLHLVARAHASESIDLSVASSEEVEKAVLYRSIIDEAGIREEAQRVGEGRLDAKGMRSFVQALALEMYSSGREALDYTDGLPILKNIYKNATEKELGDLSQVAIVSQPQLTKGEQGGF